MYLRIKTENIGIILQSSKHKSIFAIHPITFKYIYDIVFLHFQIYEGTFWVPTAAAAAAAAVENIGIILQSSKHKSKFAIHHIQFLFQLLPPL